MPKSVLVISTLDTKGQETLYLKDKLSAIGLAPILMDISGRGSDIAEIDIPAALVAESGGGNFEEIQISRDRTRITNIMMAGGSRLAAQLLTQGKLDGVIALGGSTGSLMASEVMRSLPFGIPKVMISSTAALPGLSTRYIGTGDIALFHSVVEISGLPDLLKNVMDRAAYALAGMVSDDITSPKTAKGKAIALTMLGPCEKCASAVRVALEAKGYQIIGFSAAGIGDRAMEDMIAEGFFQGVIDLAPGGVGEHLFGFMRDAGPNRLETAGKLGLPQIISTGSVNHMTPSRSKYKPEYHERRKFDLDKLRTWIRLSPDELKKVAGVFADKLNQAKGPVTVMIPLNGWSAADLPGNDTHDPAEDRIFTEVLRKKIKPEIQIVEVDANMEDPEFAKAVVANALKIF
ncbi:MAG: Tm-1-like ATP-binding domain-containing protein [Deltaproteobacteria bacterium]|nr:Tm-1-like ATP-binding domain-containing protein [Deltaproteobacteria bacterium]